MLDFLLSLAYGAGFFIGLLLAWLVLCVVWARTERVRSRIWRSWPRPVRKTITVIGWVLLVLFVIAIMAAQGADIRGEI